MNVDRDMPADAHEKERHEDFSNRLLDKHTWFLAAADLLRTAELVAPEVEAWWRTLQKRNHGSKEISPERRVQRVYFMLVGHAAENLCKAALVARLSAAERVVVERGGKLPADLKSHRLLRLVRAIGFPCGDDELFLLPRLEMCSVWFGRYPVPVEARRLFRQEIPDGTATNTGYFWSGDTRGVREFVERLKLFVGYVEPSPSLLEYDG